MEKLWPCPFCGEEAVLCGSKTTFKQPYSVGCKRCQFYGPPDYDHPDNAISAWNHRAAPAPSSPSLAAREAAEEIVQSIPNQPWPEDFGEHFIAWVTKKIEAAIRRAPGPGWVKVSERLPKRPGWHLTAHRGVRPLWFDMANERWLPHPGSNIHYQAVRQWAPLPDPPKEDT